MNDESCPLATCELIKCQQAFNQLQNKYNKLIKFAKQCAKGERYLNTFCATYVIKDSMQDVSTKATDLLKEIGELC